jgi:spoIIIJ-associated protein
MNKAQPTNEFVAPSIEEAVIKGLEDLGLPEDAVEITILEEGSKGLFGLGFREAKVRLTLKTEEQNLVTEKHAYVEDKSDKPPSLLINEDQDLLQIAQETVSDLIEKMKIKADITAEFGEKDDLQRHPPLYIDIQGKDLSMLIGRKAETLNALQFISRLILGKELERSIPIIVDVEGYRKRREQQIRKLAQRVADQVIETGRSQALEPMPPNERRIVHIELREYTGVFTESIGEGLHRKVVVYPIN